MKPLLYALPDSEAFARGLGDAWPAEVGTLALHHFPDGESLVRLDTDPRERAVALVCTLHQPDRKVVPLLLAAATARELGASSVGLVAPYLAYMRQDRAFHPGESRSALHFARLLSAHFDWLVTVDPHLHRYATLDQIYTIPATTVASAPLLSRWIGLNVERPLVIGPDAESRQWVEAVAGDAGVPWCVLEKIRTGDREVEIRWPDLGAWAGCTPVLADDIVASGATMAAAIRELRSLGFPPPVCVAVHAAFAPGASEVLRLAGAARVVTANTIAHPTNAIDVSGAVAAACRSVSSRA